MKKLCICAAAIFVAVLVCSCCTCRKHIEQKELQALREYYTATERFMQELDDDTNGLVIEAGSDAGCDYWDAKIALENLYNEK